MDPRTEIASGFTVARYSAIRPGLNSASPETPEWREVISAFERRIRERFFDPIRRLEEDDAHTTLSMRPGFAIIALCCVLIETLNSFENGGPLPSNQGQSRSKFIEFLEKRLAFAQEDAESLYRNVRNKLLHDGDTQQDWKIVRGSGAAITSRNDGIRVLNRIPFRTELEEQFIAYFGRLRSLEEINLRERFKSRFDVLCNTGDVSGE